MEQVGLQVLREQAEHQVHQGHQVLRGHQGRQELVVLMGYHRVKYIFSMKVSIRTFQVIKN
jgi:hypothetical protein